MSLRIEVAVAMPQLQEVIALELEEGATVADALAVANLAARFPTLDWSNATQGVWSRPCAPTRLLQDGDRVEVYRPLAADPKDARRARAKLKASP